MGKRALDARKPAFVYPHRAFASAGLDPHFDEAPQRRAVELGRARDVAARFARHVKLEPLPDSAGHARRCFDVADTGMVAGLPPQGAEK